LCHESGQFYLIAALEYPDVAAEVAAVIVNVGAVAAVNEEPTGFRARWTWALGNLCHVELQSARLTAGVIARLYRLEQAQLPKGKYCFE
jgi:hypothetical protein